MVKNLLRILALSFERHTQLMDGTGPVHIALKYECTGLLPARIRIQQCLVKMTM
uniref:Uncharacterized protein n=1 Tax=Romanomermis culicivorax TaxID=13658 RepID=A0A915KVI8_ROMCU